VLTAFGNIAVQYRRKSDALVLYSAEASGAKSLYSEDLFDGQTIGSCAASRLVTSVADLPGRDEHEHVSAVLVSGPEPAGGAVMFFERRVSGQTLRLRL
jgi:hypothetical protein